LQQLSELRSSKAKVRRMPSHPSSQLVSALNPQANSLLQKVIEDAAKPQRCRQALLQARICGGIAFVLIVLDDVCCEKPDGPCL
jgi:hypothetical protein